MAKKTSKTAATHQYLIERVGKRVALCEQQGGQWVTIRRSINRRAAQHFGFNIDNPTVQAIFAGLE